MNRILTALVVALLFLALFQHFLIFKYSNLTDDLMDDNAKLIHVIERYNTLWDVFKEHGVIPENTPIFREKETQI